jgi:hypothetical protein
MTPQEIQEQLNGIKDSKISTLTEKSLDATRKLYVPIHQYDLDGNYIQTFESMSHANRKTKIGTGTINSYLNGKVYQAGGFLWSYDKVDTMKPKKIPSGNQSVEVYDLDGNLVETFDSINKLGYWLYPNSPKCKRKLHDLKTKVRNKYVIKKVEKMKKLQIYFSSSTRL